MATNRKAKERSSNFELLRIIAMWGVVIAHLVGYSPEVSLMFEGASKQTLYLSILSCAGKIGLHAFVMISGYFLVKSSFKWMRIFKVWKTTWIWSVLLLILAIIFGLRQISGGDVLSALLPVLGGAEYWFVPTYIIIILVSPVINKLLLEKRREFLLKLLIGIVVLFYGLNFLGDICGFRIDLILEHRLLSYMLSFAVGGYLRLYPPKLKMQTRVMLLIGSILLLAIWRAVRIYCMGKTGAELWVAHDQDVMIFVVAMALFIVFMGWNLKYNKLINYMGGATFAVYLITENPFIRPLLWQNIDIYTVFNTKMLYVYPVVMGGMVTVCCIAIELVRAKIGSFIYGILPLQKRKIAKGD